MWIAMQHSPTQTGGMSVHGECVHEQTKRVDPRVCVCTPVARVYACALYVHMCKCVPAS
jgi:hypothetical protein